MRNSNTKPYAHLSLTGRLAVALCCIEKVFHLKRVVHQEIDLYLDWLWEFVYLSGSGEDFDSWMGKMPQLIDTAQGWEFPEGFEVFLEGQGYDPRDFRMLIEWGSEILFMSLYSIPHNELSLEHLGKVLEITRRDGINPPPAEIFNDSAWKDHDGWGRRLTKEEAAIWRLRGVKNL